MYVAVGPPYGEYGIFNASIQPSLAPNKTQWTFEYSSGGGNVAVTWVCDPTVNTYQVLGNWDSLQLSIASSHACPKEYKCAYFNDNATLDLSDLFGGLIRYEDLYSGYSFEYSICTNNIKCNANHVMAIRWNISAQECDPYLAIYNGLSGYDLAYDDGQKTWKITYYNGEICEETGVNTKFYIYWTCSEDAGNWTIDGVDNINYCDYEMFLHSSYAC